MSAQPLLLSQLFPISTDRNCSVKDLFFSPLRFCGRLWMWIDNDNNSQISQVAFKVLTIPFFVCTTILSGFPAVIGALAFSGDNIPSTIEQNPDGDISLLRKNITNEEVARRVKDRLNKAGYKYSVEVKSLKRGEVNNYYPNHIHRYVTITNPSNVKITRFFEVIKNHFYNKDSPSLGSLYPCIYKDNVEENLLQLKRVMALHKSVTFSLAFDLAYVRTELGHR